MTDSNIKQREFPSTVTRATRATLLAPTLLGLVTGCEQRAPLVYVLESPQSVTLTTSAPSTARQGEAVVLRVARRASGQWKQIPRDQLKAGQCWVYQPPAASEDEVAADVQWDVAPRNAVRFEREYRMDRARVATMVADGTIKLTPFSPVTCEQDRVIEGQPVYIEVSPGA